MKKQLHITCIQSVAGDIEAMTEKAKQITRRTFIRNCETPHKHLIASWDYHITYWKSVYRGQPCYYIDHSRIEYVFI